MREALRHFSYKSGVQQRSQERWNYHSALTRLVALLGLVDDVYAALATHELVVAVTLAQALEAVANFHGLNPYSVCCGRPHIPFKNRVPHRHRHRTRKILSPNGGRDRDRTCDPYHVKVVLYR